jgi:hypothetical protein
MEIGGVHQMVPVPNASYEPASFTPGKP